MAGADPIKITSLDEFNAKLAEAGGKLVLVDFYADWCGPCRQISPTVKAISQSDKDVLVLTVDVDECAEVSQHCEISCMPTFIFYKSGVKVETFSGANADKLKAKVEELK